MARFMNWNKRKGCKSCTRPKRRSGLDRRGAIGRKGNKLSLTEVAAMSRLTKPKNATMRLNGVGNITTRVI